MTDRFSFILKARDGRARTGAIATPRGHHPHARLHAGRHRRHGEGDVPRGRAATGADIILANTYHLMLRPGAERVARLGGLA